LKLGKAPGPDAFPPEVIKALIENLPQYCLQLMNRLLNAVVFSILLYGAPIWEHAMKVERFRNYLKRIVRQNAARVSSAYRTALTEALEVIAGFPPIDLLVAERTRVYEEGRESRPDSRKCYKLLSKIVAMPSQRTSLLLLEKVPFDVGINAHLFRHINDSLSHEQDVCCYLTK
jgi:hypothetical protein